MDKEAGCLSFTYDELGKAAQSEEDLISLCNKVLRDDITQLLEMPSSISTIESLIMSALFEGRTQITFGLGLKLKDEMLVEEHTLRHTHWEMYSLFPCFEANGVSAVVSDNDIHITISWDEQDDDQC